MHADDDYSLQDYAEMVIDHGRAQPYLDALRALVTPDTVMLEIGTGFGYFAMHAAQLGARRIYAVEPADAIAVARLCGQDMPRGDNITWIQGLTTTLDLPEQADIVIGDMHGTLPFYNHNVDSMIDARRRHLKPGGTILPSRDILHMAPAHATHEYDRIQAPWTTNDAGVDLRAGRGFIANSWWRARKEPVSAEQLLATPQVWGIIDYARVETTALDNRLQWTVERAGTMHGYYVWFDSELTDGIGLSNDPRLDELVYGRAFFPLEHPVDIRPGDRIDVRMTARYIESRHVHRWDTRIQATNGDDKASFRQSTFRASPIDKHKLQLANANHVPQLTQDGWIAHAALAAMTTGQTSAAIAEDLHAQFPGRFATMHDALQVVAQLSVKYSESSAAHPDSEAPAA